MSSEGIAAQFTSIKDAFERFELSCKARATNSFPDPFCPVISTRASEGATFSIMANIPFIEADSPIIEVPLNLRMVVFN